MPADVIQIREAVELDFFQEVDTNSEWQLVDIDFIAENQIIVNKGTIDIEFSYDGRQTHGILDGALSEGADGESVTFDNRMRRQVWFRSPAGESRVRIYAWRNP